MPAAVTNRFVAAAGSQPRLPRSEGSAVMQNQTGLSSPKLPWIKKLSYGLADMGFNFFWANIATFLMIFLHGRFRLVVAREYIGPAAPK